MAASDDNSDEVTIEIGKLVTTPRRLQALWSVEMAQDLKAFYGLDVAYPPDAHNKLRSAGLLKR